MKINTEKFKQALSIVKPGLSNKDIIEQATKFVFMEGKLVTFNDEISIQHPLEELDFTGAVNSDELYKLVSRLKTEETEINHKDNELVFKAGRIKAGIILHKEINLPLEEIDEKQGEWKKLPKDFTQGLKFVVGSCSSDMSSQIITCVNITGNTVSGSDRFRIARYEFKKDLPFETLIPAKTVKDLINFKPALVAKGSGGWLHFKDAQDVVFSCRILNEKYPNCDFLFEMKKPRVVALPPSLPEILERVTIFTDGDTQLDERVSVSFLKNKMVVESSSAVGWIKETEKIEYSDKDLDFIISPYLFRDIVKNNNTMKVTKDKVMFEDKNWKYVAALVIKSE